MDDRRGIFDGPAQFEANLPLTLAAHWETVSGQERGFMHQAMLFVRHAIDAALGYEFSGPVFALHNSLSELTCFPKREPVILKSSKLADKGRGLPGSAARGRNQGGDSRFPCIRKPVNGKELRSADAGRSSGAAVRINEGGLPNAPAEI